MAIDLQTLIENVIDDAFARLHTRKRGPRHRSLKIGLNLNRKHQNVIADIHKADPNAVQEVEQLRGVENGKKLVSAKEGEALKQKYGIDDTTGFLGTTGIKIIPSGSGFILVKGSNG